MTEDQQDPQVALGRQLVSGGWLRGFREELGVSANVVAGWLNSNSHHVGRLERGDVKWVQLRTAQRVAQLHEAYEKALRWLRTEDLEWSQVETLRGAAHRLGMAVSTLRSKLTERDVEPIDFGPVLGEWIEKSEAEACRR